MNKGSNNIFEEKKKSTFSKISEVLRTMASKPSGFIGLFILTFHIFLAFLSPYFVPYDYKAIDPRLCYKLHPQNIGLEQIV